MSISKEKLFVSAKWLAVFAAALAPAILSIYCGAGVPLTAPGGATLSMTANPPTITAVNGVSTITVLGFKSSTDGGGPLANGTQVYFTTTLGIIEERVEMQNGIARATLRSTGVSGTATVVANSGSGATGGGGGGSTSTAPGGGTTTTTPAGGGGTGGAVTASVTVNIGNAGGIRLILTATPATVGPPDFTSQLVVTAFDLNNNPLPNIPVIFKTTAGALASAGSILLTNTLGQAADRLTLRNEATATVSATSGSVTSDPPVIVNRSTAGTVAVTSVSPSSGSPGSTLTLTISGRGFQPGALVTFSGGGITVNSRTFVSAEVLRVNISISSSAALTARDVSVLNPDTATAVTAVGAFTVGSATTTTVAASPTVASVTPTSAAQGQTVNVTIAGTNFQSGIIVSFGTGITVNTVTFTSSSLITANITVAAAAATGARNVQVTNPNGTTGTLMNGFTVTSSAGPAPIVLSVNPPDGDPDTLEPGVVITGTNFQPGAQVGFGAGIGVSNIMVISSNQITVDLNIALGAAPGPRTVTVINPDGGTGSLAGGFTVN